MVGRNGKCDLNMPHFRDDPSYFDAPDRDILNSVTSM
jgi:hypothetical protein